MVPFGAPGREPLTGLVEVSGDRPGRLRLTAIADISADSLHAFLATNLATTLALGATARTDGWAGYPGAPDLAHTPHVAKIPMRPAAGTHWYRG